MLRILLVAPGLGLQTTNEMRDLTTLHRVTVLSDKVLARDVYSAARGGYDVIHYAGHSNSEQVELSDGHMIDTDLLQIARISGAKMVFFNSCLAGRLAHYLVGHGVPLAIHTNVDLVDADAWKMPLAFYGAVDRLGNSTPSAYIRAFADANDGEGLYGMAMQADLVIGWAQMASLNIVRSAHPSLQRWQWGIVAAIVGITVWLTLLSIFPLLGA